MDPVTHFLTGACISRAGLNRKTALATLTLTLAAEAPDLDVVMLLGGPVVGFQHHRGTTHTFLGAPFVAAAVVGFVYGIHKLWLNKSKPSKDPPRWGLLYLYALLGALSHILLDFTNNYGVRPLAPFDPKWYSWDIVAIVEPLLLLFLIAGLVLPSLFGLISDEVGSRKQPYRGRGGAITALVLVAMLWGVRDYQHRKAVSALSAPLYQGRPALRASAFPYPINPFAWHGVVETEEFFETVHVDSRSGELDPEQRALTFYKPEETEVTLAAKKSRLGQVYLDWAYYPMVETEKRPQDSGYLVRFYDLRYRYPERKENLLGGSVELGPDLKVEVERMGRRVQKP